MVYGYVVHQIPTNIFLNPMKEGGAVELEVGPGKSSLIRMVTKKIEFAREEVTHLVTYQNAALNSGGGGG